MKKGLWLLPSKNRPDSLKRFFAAYVATKATTHVCVIVNYDDMNHSTVGVDIPEGCSVRSMRGVDCVADAINNASLFLLKDPEIEWIGLICDDHIPETEAWDIKLIEQANGFNVVSSNDGWQAPRRIHGAIVFSADLLRAVGWIYPPGIKHSFQDDAWEYIGARTGIWKTDMGIMVRHAHGSVARVRDDVSEAIKERFSHDERVYRTWKRDGAGETIARIQDLMKSKGVGLSVPDLTGISLMIATPSTEKRYVGTYTESLIRTRDMLRDLGAIVDWAQAPYMAEVSYARAKMIGSFHRSPHTHLLMIDDDMGWEPEDVIRMLIAGRDFVAAAGQKKTEGKTEFAWTPFFEGSQTLEVDPVGMLSIPEVGGAFVMLSRACVERMIAAYPELAFDEDSGAVEYDLFCPVIIRKPGGGRRRLPEDYAFCHRWRKIGGKIFLMPDIGLDHVGQKTWNAAVIDLFAAQGAAQAAE